MDKAKKNTVIHAAADRMAANYKSSQIPMYGDALRMPNRCLLYTSPSPRDTR